MKIRPIPYSLLVLFILSMRGLSFAETFYVDKSAGSDSLDGMSALSPWRTLDKVNSMTFRAGDSILLKRGEVWSGYLHPLGSGTPGRPITVSAYGEGSPPMINTGGGYPTAVLLLNQEYWEIENLEITNLHPTNLTSSKYGVYVISNNVGVLHHIVLRNLVIHHVNGNPASKTCGGIFFEVLGTVPAWFDSITVEGCDVSDLSPVGIANTSSFATRTLTTTTNWYPSLNIILRNNSIRRTVRNGMIIRVARRPLIEHNVFQECGKDSSGNAVFVFNCDTALIQYNEALLTRFNTGDEDAGGFDADYRCKGTIIQYNYSHHNEYGGIVVVSDGSGTDTFNDGTIVRYNVLKDNLSHALRVSGNVTNTVIYNNTVYSSTAAGAVVAVWHKSWGGFCDKTSYFNNIFELQKFGSSIQLNGSTNNLFDYNLFHGVRLAGEPVDQHKMTADPRFVAPDSVGDGWSSASGLRLQPDSPAIDSGMTVQGHCDRDFLGTPVPSGGGVDRGAFEYQTPMEVVDEEGYSFAPQLLEAYPNPFNPVTTISFRLEKPSLVRLTVHNLLGRLVAILLSERRGSGLHQVSFNSSGLPSGVYFYTLEAGKYRRTNRFLLLR